MKQTLADFETKSVNFSSLQNLINSVATLLNLNPSDYKIPDFPSDIIGTKEGNDFIDMIYQNFLQLYNKLKTYVGQSEQE
jgi:hypothetical protein